MSASDPTIDTTCSTQQSRDAAAALIADVLVERAVKTAVDPTVKHLMEMEAAQMQLSAALSRHDNAVASVEAYMKHNLEPTFAKLPEYTAKVKRLKKQMDAIEESVKNVHGSMISVAKDVRAHVATMDQVDVGDAIKDLK